MNPDNMTQRTLSSPSADRSAGERALRMRRRLERLIGIAATEAERPRRPAQR
ncbi:hypothetical protein SHIRM173S_00576 [Streptomyces hirsutus]